MAVGERLVVRRIQRLHRRSAGGERGVDPHDVVLRRGEDHGDRLQLRDRDDPGLLGRRDEIALVDEPEAGAPRYRRADRRVIELHRGRVDRRRIGCDLRDELRNQRILRIELLLGRETLLGQRRIALQVEPGVGEIGLVLGLLRFGLVERRLVGARIDLGDQIARLDHLAFGEADLDDLAVDPRAHRDRIIGLNLTKTLEIDGVVGARGAARRLTGAGGGALASRRGREGSGGCAFSRRAAARAICGRRRRRSAPIFPTVSGA